MNKYEHISRMETILNDHKKLLEDLSSMLDRLEAHQSEYRKLIEYYYSDRRNQDLADDEKRLIPNDLCRGVLSEDAIFDLMGDQFDAGIRMVELGLNMIKER